MKITRMIKAEQDIRYLKATMGVRYWVDCEYSEDNGKTWNRDFDDTREESERIKSITPCVVNKNIGYDESDYLELIIDLEEGKVLNWKDGFCLNTNYKVCDDGEYKQYYVPDFLSIENTGYGDYVYLNIDGSGRIEHFDVMKSEIESYFEDLNDED